MQYQFQIRVNFEALDDVEARAILQHIKADCQRLLEREDTDTKFQRLYQNKPPEKVIV